MSKVIHTVGRRIKNFARICPGLCIQLALKILTYRSLLCLADIRKKPKNKPGVGFSTVVPSQFPCRQSVCRLKDFFLCSSSVTDRSLKATSAQFN